MYLLDLLDVYDQQFLELVVYIYVCCIIFVEQFCEFFFVVYVVICRGQEEVDLVYCFVLKDVLFLEVL